MRTGTDMQDVLQPRYFLKAMHGLGMTEAKLPCDVVAGCQNIAYKVEGKSVTITTCYFNNLFAGQRGHRDWSPYFFLAIVDTKLTLTRITTGKDLPRSCVEEECVLSTRTDLVNRDTVIT